MKNLQNLKIKGYTGRWSAFDSYRNYYILENDYYGDETCYLVINEYGWNIYVGNPSYDCNRIARFKTLKEVKDYIDGRN